MAKFQPGHPKTPGCGRPKGSMDQYTKLKLEFLAAFQKTGGTKTLIEWASRPENQRDFYRMVVGMLPKSVEVKGDAEAPLTIIVRKLGDG